MTGDDRDRADTLTAFENFARHKGLAPEARAKLEELARFVRLLEEARRIRKDLKRGMRRLDRKLERPDLAPPDQINDEIDRLDAKAAEFERIQAEIAAMMAARRAP